MSKEMNLKMIYAVCKDLNPFGCNGRDIGSGDDGPIGRTDGDGICSSSNETNGRGESGQTLLKETSKEPEWPHDGGGQDFGVACVGICQRPLQHGTEFDHLRRRFLLLQNERQLVFPNTLEHGGDAECHPLVDLRKSLKDG
jgi:hypothetical protein